MPPRAKQAQDSTPLGRMASLGTHLQISARHSNMCPGTSAHYVRAKCAEIDWLTNKPRGPLNRLVPPYSPPLLAFLNTARSIRLEVCPVGRCARRQPVQRRVEGCQQGAGAQECDCDSR